MKRYLHTFEGEKALKETQVQSCVEVSEGGIGANKTGRFRIS